MPATLDERLSLAVELAMTAGKASAPILARQEQDARRLGLSGAEIDAARQGRVFDALAARAVALALAVREGQPAAIEAAAGQAIRAGLAPHEIDAIVALTEQFVEQAGRG